MTDRKSEDREGYQEACLIAQKYMEEIRSAAGGKANIKRGLSPYARKIGKSPSMLTQFLDGTYPGKYKPVITAILDHHTREADRQAFEFATECVGTVQTRITTNFVTATHAMRSIGILLGTAGIGKTVSVNEYASGKATVVYIHANPFIRSKSQFLDVLCRMLGIRGVKNSGVAFERVKEICAQKDILLVVDDAHELSTVTSKNTTVFEIIRSLNDAGVAILLIGNEDLHDDVWQTNSRAFYQQFISRAEMCRLDDSFSREDTDAVIQSVIAGKIAPEISEELHRLAEQYIGSLRIMKKILVLAALRARGGRLTMQHIENAMKNKFLKLKPKYEKLKRIKGRVINFGEEQKENGGDSKPLNVADGQSQAAG